MQNIMEICDNVGMQKYNDIILKFMYILFVCLFVTWL